MYEAKGVGLAAPQVGVPLRLIVTNPTGDAKHTELERVFVNPVLSSRRGNTEKEEGCLSLPGIWAKVKRAKTIHLDAYSLDGTAINETLDVTMSRVLQHECDHLDGVLFIDRISPVTKRELNIPLAAMESEYRMSQQFGHIPADAEIIKTLEQAEFDLVSID